MFFSGLYQEVNKYVACKLSILQGNKQGEKMKNPLKRKQHEVTLRAYATWAMLYRYAYERGLIRRR
jgi:hypothetical protein